MKSKQGTSTLLSVIGAVGVIGTAVLAAKATPKAVELIKEDIWYNHDGDPITYAKKEAVKACWKVYIPAAGAAIGTLICIFGASALNRKQQATITSSYALLSETYRRYKQAAKDMYGEDADEKIEAQMADEQYISAGGYSLYDPDRDDASEKVLFYDSYSKRYFQSTVPAVLNAIYHLNRNLTLRGNASVNEFYGFLGIDPVDESENAVWDMEELVTGGIMWLDFDNHYTTMDDGMECCIISAAIDPTLELPF